LEISPESSYIFTQDRDDFGDGAPVRLELEDGTFTPLTPAVATGLPNQFVRHRGFEWPALSPDGKWLFADGGRLLRYRIGGTTLTLDAATREDMGSGHKEGICVSPDSQWVCFPTGGGNDGAGYGTYIYRIADMSKPACLLKQDAYPEIVGSDPVSQRIFTQNYDHPLMVYDHTGKNLGTYRLGTISGSHNIKQYAAHPTDGRSLLLRTSQHLVLVEFANNR
jgi:hypothetical protein